MEKKKSEVPLVVREYTYIYALQGKMENQRETENGYESNLLPLKSEAESKYITRGETVFLNFIILFFKKKKKLFIMDNNNYYYYFI